MHKNKIKELFYKNKDYSKIKELLQNSNESWSFNLLGKIALYEKEPELAYDYFNKAGNICACSYVRFLQGNIEEARILLLLIKETSPVTKWLMFLINFLYDNKFQEPTYFQIRNFYEQDLEMMFLYEQSKIINELLKRNNFLSNYNREIYKYSARVLHNNEYTEQAKILLKKSLEICYKDPETHFLMGEIYEKTNEIDNAKLAYQKALDACPDYMPAKLKINNLSNWLYNLYYRVK